MRWRSIREKLGYVPLTWAGLVLALGLAVAVYFRGVEALDLVALAAGIGVLVVEVLAIVAVLIGVVWVRGRLRAQEQPTVLELASGRTVSSGFSLQLWRYVPLLRLNWSVDEFSAEVEVEPVGNKLREMICCKRRGTREALTRRFTLSDTLGLSSVTWKMVSPGRIRVLPDPGCLERPNILMSLVSGEDISDPRGDPQGDRVDMRQYHQGDPMKFILWKVYSRSGKVMVRVPERALAARPRACCYLLCGPEDEASAALARVLLEMRMLGEEWRFGADGSSGFSNRVGDALDRIARSGHSETSEPGALAAFLTQAEKDGYGFCLVLAPPGDEKLAAAVLDALGRTRMRSEVWIGLDVETEEAEDWTRYLKVLRPPGISPRDVHNHWNGRATLIERNTGRVMTRTQGPPR